MKTKTILFLFLLISGIMSAQVKRIAILETVDKENKVPYANKLILRTSLSKAIANTAGYEVYDRTDIDAIMSEHTFQRTGLVSNDQIKRLGEMTGAEYILVAEAVKVNAKNLFVTAKLLDVETARTIVTEMMEINIDHMQQGCTILAKKMFSEKRELDFGEQIPIGPQLVRNSKADQKLYGLGVYSYGETQMDKKAYETFLRENSPEIYKRYLRGQNCIKAGWAMFGIGVATTVVGGICMGLEEPFYEKSDEYEDAFSEECDIERWVYDNDYEWYDRKHIEDNHMGNYVYSYLMNDSERYLYDAYMYYKRGREVLVYVGIGVMIGGGILTAASIPLLSIGYGMNNNIHKRYNEQAQEQTKLTLNIQCSQNGIGVALNF